MPRKGKMARPLNLRLPASPPWWKKILTARGILYFLSSGFID
jgi:hypothetical protein